MTENAAMISRKPSAIAAMAKPFLCRFIPMAPKITAPTANSNAGMMKNSNEVRLNAINPTNENAAHTAANVPSTVLLYLSSGLPCLNGLGILEPNKGIPLARTAGALIMVVNPASRWTVLCGLARIIKAASDVWTNRLEEANKVSSKYLSIKYTGVRILSG
jgi:hypothetical protein